jgi:hypothetical protein
MFRHHWKKNFEKTKKNWTHQVPGTGTIINKAKLEEHTFIFKLLNNRKGYAIYKPIALLTTGAMLIVYRKN